MLWCLQRQYREGSFAVSVKHLFIVQSAIGILNFSHSGFVGFNLDIVVRYLL